MFGIDDALLGTIGGSVISGMFGAAGQEAQNEANIAASQKQMDFQERMSSTAYERAVGSMQRAGLNPMLAYSQGGASAPMGSMPQIGNVAGAATNSASSGAAIAQAIQNVLQSRSQTDLIDAQAEKTRSETMARDLNTAYLKQQIYKLGTSGGVDEEDADLRRYQKLNVALDSDSKEEVLRAMKAGKGFQADVALKRANARLGELDVEKGSITKLPYELLNQLIGSKAGNSAESIVGNLRRRSVELGDKFRATTPWWKSRDGYGALERGGN